MSLSNLLSIARTALISQQRVIDTTGHNIANASTEGYSRQRIILAPQAPQQTPFGQVGRGVDAIAIQRFRDRFLDANYRRENGELGRHTTGSDLLSQVEGMFGEPSSTGLGAVLDNFLSSFADLANDPAGPAPRALVRNAAVQLSQRLQEMDRRISEAQADVVSRMESGVQEVNEIMRQVADLDTRIRTTGAGSRDAPDVKDQQDRLLDRLSSLVGVRVLDRGDGTLAVAVGDALLIDAGQFSTFEVRDQGGGRFAVAITGAPGRINLQSGELGALVDLSMKTLPDLRRALDDLASGLVTEVNALHAAGRSLNGVTGIAFFDGTGLTAASIRLSATIEASTDNIAAGMSGGALDNATALAIAGLRTNAVASFQGQTIGGAYQRLVAELGVATRDASDRRTAQDALVQHTEELRRSVAGVSIDEELTNLIAQQNAYAASARLVSVADQMMQEVIGMVR